MYSRKRAYSNFMKNEIILVTGVSGTGKTTVHRELKKRGIATIGIDETEHLSYWISNDGKVVVGEDVDFNKEFLANHQWVCELPVLEDLIAKSGKPVIVCGSSDNISDCMKLCDLTLLLKCSSETFVSRIKARDDNEYGKSEAAEQALLGYYKTYNQECINAGAIPINAEESVENVVKEILSYTA